MSTRSSLRAIVGAAGFALLTLATVPGGTASAQDPANGAPGAPGAAERVLRVCADPNNLPFTNEREEGFENRIAELIAEEMNARLEYQWWPQRRGWVRHNMREQRLCDLAIGVPSTYELVLTTKPYYRSTYVFVYRKDRNLSVRSFDDPVLRELKIGVHLIGDDYNNTPPAHALSNRNISGNVVGYSIFGDYAEEAPPARLMEAVASGDVDIAIVWGPLAGYFARRSPVPLEIVPVSPAIELPFLPMVYDISLGVRRTPGAARGEDAEAEAFKAELETILDRRQAEIRRILEEYGVPLVDRATRRASS